MLQQEQVMNVTNSIRQQIPGYKEHLTLTIEPVVLVLQLATKDT